MTRKNFITIAEALRASRPIGPTTGDPRFAEAIEIYNIQLAQWEKERIGVADALARFTNAFDRAKFLAVCEQ